MHDPRTAGPRGPVVLVSTVKLNYADGRSFLCLVPVSRRNRPVSAGTRAGRARQTSRRRSPGRGSRIPPVPPDASRGYSHPINLGAALAGLGRFEEAISEYNIALEPVSLLVEARLNLALCYYKMGGVEDASNELEKVHSESPDNHQAALLLERLLHAPRAREGRHPNPRARTK